VSLVRSRSVFGVMSGLVIASLLAACGQGATATGPSSGSGVSPEPSATPTRLVVGLGFIPSVQFAQFYLAEQTGLYAKAGLDIEFQNKIDPDLIALVGQGAIDVGIGDGTSVIPAVSNEIPIQYIATIYGKFPNVVFAKASSGIKTAADLKGKKIGTPGRYGSGWVMLQALLGSAGLTTDDVEIIEYPDFTQELAVEQGAVDAATGFANNEPVQLERNGETAVVLRIDDVTPLPGPGLVSGITTLDSKGDAIAGFVAATLEAMEEIRANPQAGLDAAIVAVPELASASGQAEVLAATIDSWAGPVQASQGLGAIDRDGWSASIAYLGTLGLVNAPVSVEDVVRDDLLPSGG
jgi:NitT/TauT family transport system substrate-binding protein